MPHGLAFDVIHYINKRLIKALKYLLRLCVLLVLGGYLLLLGITAIPSVQRWLAGIAADMLAERVGTRVRVQRIRAGLPGRLIVDGLQVYDQRDSLMLHVPRVAAKLDVMPLLEHRISISNAQLFGARAILYQAAPDSAPNWQFLVDALSNPNDTTSSPLNLRIGSLLVRRCQARYDRLYLPHTPGRLDANHLAITDLSVTARLGCLTRDSVSMRMDKLAFREQSGLELGKLQFRLSANRDSLRLEHLDMQLPRTSLTIPLLTATYPGLPVKGKPVTEWLSLLQAHAQVEVKAVPADLAPIIPSLRHLDQPLTLTAQAQLGDGGRLSLSGLRFSAPDNMLLLTADAQCDDLFHSPSCTIHLHDLGTTHALWQQLPKYLPSLSASLAERLQSLGDTHSSGHLFYSKKKISAEVATHTEVGRIEVKGNLADQDHFEADLTLSDAHIDRLLQHAPQGQPPLGLSLSAALHGRLHGADNRPEVSASGHVQSLTFRQHTYHDISFHASVTGHEYQLAMQANEEQGHLSLDALANVPPSGTRRITLTGSLEQFSPSALHLTDALPGESISGQIQADIALPASGQPEGEIHLAGLTLSSLEKGLLDIGAVDFSCHTDSGLQRVSLQSDVARLEASGMFRWKSIPQAVLALTHRHLPSVISAPHMGSGAEDVDLNFNLHVRDTAVVARLSAPFCCGRAWLSQVNWVTRRSFSV